MKGIQSNGYFGREQFKKIITGDVAMTAVFTPKNLKRVFIAPLLPSCTQELSPWISLHVGIEKYPEQKNQMHFFLKILRVSASLSRTFVYRSTGSLM